MMEVEEKISFKNKLKYILNNSLNNVAREEEKKFTRFEGKNCQIAAEEHTSKKINNFHRKCIELGLEANDSSPSTPQSEKYDSNDNSDFSESDNGKISVSETYASLSSSAEDSSDNVSEMEVKDDNALLQNIKSELLIEKDIVKNTVKLDNKQQSHISNFHRKRSLKRKRNTFEEKNLEESNMNSPNSDVNCPSEKYMRIDTENEVDLDIKQEYEISEQTYVNYTPDIEKSVQNPVGSQSPYKSSSKILNSKSLSSEISSNIVDQITKAFTKQLPGLNLENLIPLQGSKLRAVLESKKNSCIPSSDTFQRNGTSRSSSTTSPNRLSIDTDDMLPIQAEVVMSEGSDSEQNNEIQSYSINENMENYINSFMDCSANGSIIEYPPLSNEVPTDCSDLSVWQLEHVSLPPFRPFVPPPPWLRFTIPPEGYKCESCGDTFFIESSLVQHKERRSVWITIECGPCDAKLTFYNKCAFKSHIQNHVAKGERVEEERVDVKALPLQLAKLLQPIIVPVPQTLRAMKTPTKGSPCKTPKKGSSSSQGKENLPTLASPVITALVSPSSDAGKICSDGSEHIQFIPPSSSKRSVKCYLCERMFGGVRELMSHMRTNQSYSDQRVECRKCLLVLPSVCAAKAHILTHPPANTSNISVCPECGSRCDGPRDFVHHLNTCGHQYRRSGIKCQQCQVSFFKFSEDFVNHWIKEHCTRSYECVVCCNTFESLVFHQCSSPGKQVLATFKCLLSCPICPYIVQVHTQEEKETFDKIRAHLSETHPSVINRVHYVYKSKFCTNAFRSKDELRAHHDREHRRENHYRTKTCTLHHEVLGYQQQYFNGQEPRNAFVTLTVLLSPEEIQEAQTRDVPTVSSVIDKTLFPGGPMTLVSLKALKEREKIKEVEKPVENETKDITLKFDREHLESLRPCVCYRCGYTYTGNKDVRRHKRGCEGESTSRVCQMCGVSAIGEEFSGHCITHIAEGLILCMYCNGAPFSTTEMLHQHFELHVHEQFCYPAQCAFCPFIMPDVSKALTHLQEEHDPLSSPAVHEALNSECDRCGKKFQGERGLHIHLTRCTASGVQHTAGVTPAGVSNAVKQCHVCKKGLTPEMFGKHMIGHLEEGLLVCSLCDGLPLPSSMSLLHHLKEHSCTLQFPFLCPLCSYTMSNSDEALSHLKEDHGLGNLSCANCEMHYTFTYQMQRHIDIVHKVCLYAKRRYICWICRAYDHVKKGTLMNHFRMIHGLSMEEVDEKLMIRTRGQGTMPTSQFIPTKPLGCKETDLKNDSNLDPKNKNKRLTLPVLHKTRSHINLKRNTLKSANPNSPKNLNLENVIIKQELLDVIQNASDIESSSSEMLVDSNINGFDLGKVKTERASTPVKNQQDYTPLKEFKEFEDSHVDSSKDEHSSLNKDPQSPSLKIGQNSPLKIQHSSLKDQQVTHKNGQVSRLLRDQTRKPVIEPRVISRIKGGHELINDQSGTNSAEEPTSKLLPSKLKIKIGKKFLPRNKDVKLRGSTKVVVKRLPETVLRQRSNANKKVAKTEPKDSGQKDKAYKCSHCSYSTNSKTKLKFHESRHDENGTEGFLCNVCGQTFVVEPSLKRHLFFAHKIKQKVPALPPSQPVKREYVIEVSGPSSNNKRSTKRPKRKVVASKIRNRPVRKTESKAQQQQQQPRITIKIKSSPCKIQVKEESSEKEKATAVKKEKTTGVEKVNKVEDEEGKTAEVEEENVADMQCCVCKEVFDSSVKLYSHLRTHGMAFLKLGRKKRNFMQERTSITC